MDNAGTAPPTVAMAARMAGWFAVGAMFLLIGGPFAYRIGLLGASISIAIFVVGAVLALLAVIAGLAGVVRALTPSAKVSGAGKAAFSALVGGLALAAILHWMVIPGWNSPRIHDVTTSPKDPPEFDVLRVHHYADRDYVNYRDYDRRAGGKVSAAYPELRTLVFDKSLRQVFTAAEAAAADLHWVVVASTPTNGRIEAADWGTPFGFIDDIVIRVRLNASGYTVLDIRSASRSGTSDMGRNAARIRQFTVALKDHLPQQSRTPTQ
jgi:hypothetical protein